MNFKLINGFDLPARVLMSLIFILSGLSKVSAFEATQAYMQIYGLPPVLLLPTIAFEISAGFALVLGLKIRIFAALLAVFCLITAAVFHRDFSDQMQMIMFLKNIAMAGGFLLLAKVGSENYSLDSWLMREAG